MQIPAKIQDTTIEGDGTQATHYIVNSTTDFLFLCFKDRMYNKYVDLNCDIILNDEVFDVNGKPVSGDGIVYSWRNMPTAQGLHFDGRGHKIYGVYFSNKDVDASLFTAGAIIYENVSFDNVFFQGKKVRFLTSSTQQIKNVNMFNGTIIGHSTHVSAYVSSAKRIENCDNYFNIFAKDNYCAAFVCMVTSSSVLKNCNNYGTLTGTGVLAGIVGSAYLAGCDLYNCNNYGEIISTGGWSVSGLIAIVSKQTTIMNCGSYGKITPTSAQGTAGAFVGQVLNTYSSDPNYEVRLFIKESETEVDYGQSNIYPLVGNFSTNKAKGVFFYVEKVKINIKNLPSSKRLLGGLEKTIEYCEMKDVVVKVSGATSSSKISIFTNNQKEVLLKNILIEGDLQNFSISYYNLNIKDLNVSVEGVLANIKNGRSFYGSDFSGFYLDFKTGKIGLKAFAGKGFYQGKVTEEMLISKGYTKKEA